MVLDIFLACEPLLEIGSLLLWGLCYSTCILIGNRNEETLVEHSVNLSICRNVHQVVVTTVTVEVTVYIDRIW